MNPAMIKRARGGGPLAWSALLALAVSAALTGCGQLGEPGGLIEVQEGGQALPADGDLPASCDAAGCGAGASCFSGSCACDPGFQGDPLIGCEPIDPCAGVVCGLHAYCKAGGCVCEDGFEGDPQPVDLSSLGSGPACSDSEEDCDGTSPEDCTPIDPCFEVRCGANASCVEGTCLCDAGFEGNALLDCTRIDPCAEIECGVNASCLEGECHCAAAFEGNPYLGCDPMSPCTNVVCDPGQVCAEGACICEDPCQAEQTACADDRSQLRCEGPDDNGCFGWGAATACQADMVCDADERRCVPNTPPECFATNECLYEGQIICASSTKYRACTYGYDGCLEWDCST